MSVLLSELLVPGWAQGDDAMIGVSDIANADFNLPCHTADPDTFFADDSATITYAKSLCGGCPMKAQCLEGALSRGEPAGVWGGELFDNGQVIAARRAVGRPRLVRSAEIVELATELNESLRTVDQTASQREELAS